MYNKRDIIKKLKFILTQLDVKYDKIYLFGSRSGQDFNEESDWDFLITVKNNISEKEKRSFKARIRVEMHNFFPDMFLDLFIIEKSVFQKEKDILNTISNTVQSCGISI